MNPERCAVLVPVFGAIEPETQDRLSQLADRGYPVRLLRGSSQIDLARSILASDALRDGFEETFWIDADIVFDPDDVDRIREQGQPFTAGLYVKKGRPEIAGKFRRTSITMGEGGGLIEMEYVGMGFTHVRADVYLAIARNGIQACGGGYDPTKPILPFFLPLIVPSGDRLDYLSEDSSFCYRARQAGYRAMADTRIYLEHIGRYRYSWNDLQPRQQFTSVGLSFDVDEGKQGDNPSEKDADVEKLYAKLGQKQERLEELDEAYTKLLQMLADVVSGKMDRSRLIVDLTNRTYSWAAKGERPPAPATINGLPIVVMAQDDVPEAIAERVNGEMPTP